MDLGTPSRSCTSHMDLVIRWLYSDSVFKHLMRTFLSSYYKSLNYHTLLLIYYLCLRLIYILLLRLFIWKAELKEGGGCWYFIYGSLSDGYNNWHRARLKSAAWNSSQVSYMNSEVHALMPLSVAFLSTFPWSWNTSGTARTETGTHMGCWHHRYCLRDAGTCRPRVSLLSHCGKACTLLKINMHFIVKASHHRQAQSHQSREIDSHLTRAKLAKELEKSS